MNGPAVLQPSVEDFGRPIANNGVGRAERYCLSGLTPTACQAANQTLTRALSQREREKYSFEDRASPLATFAVEALHDGVGDVGGSFRGGIKIDDGAIDASEHGLAIGCVHLVRSLIVRIGNRR